MTLAIHSDYSEEELLVLGMLRNRRRIDALPMGQLALAVGVSTRIVQKLVKGLIEYHHEPIGSLSARNGHGYYWIHEPEDLRRAVTNLRRRALSCLKRIAKLQHATPDDVLGQLRLDLEVNGPGSTGENTEAA